MKPNPFMIYPYRKQPNRRMRCCQDNTIPTVVNGMVSLGTIAVLGGTTVEIFNALKG